MPPEGSVHYFRPVPEIGGDYVPVHLVQHCHAAPPAHLCQLIERGTNTGAKHEAYIRTGRGAVSHELPTVLMAVERATWNLPSISSHMALRNGSAGR